MTVTPEGYGRVSGSPEHGAYLQSMASPLGQPRVVLTMERACDPSHHALIILAGRYQSVQKIYLWGNTDNGIVYHRWSVLFYMFLR